MKRGRYASRVRACVWAAVVGALGAQATLCSPCFGLQCHDVRTGSEFFLPATRFTSAGLEQTDQTPFAGLCVGSVRASHSVTAADGSGGAFVVWIESAGDNCDLWVSHLDADGNPDPGFAEGGKVLCSAPGTQTQPSVAASTEGSMWAAWKDYRDPQSSAIYLTRLEAGGEPSTGYVSGGTKISAADTPASDPVLVSDHAGGAWAIWTQGRVGARGLWLDHAVIDSTHSGSGTSRRITPTGTDAYRPIASKSIDGLVLAWVESSGGAQSIRVLRLDQAGSPVPGWSSEGVAVSQSSAYLLPATLLADSSGIFVGWREQFEDSTAMRIARVQMAGLIDTRWPAGGRVVAAMTGSRPAMSSDGAGGVYVAAVGVPTAGGDVGVWLSRLTSAGTNADGWQASGLLVPNTSAGSTRPRLLTTDTGVLATWSEGSSSADGTVLNAALASMGPLPEVAKVEAWPDLVRITWSGASGGNYGIGVDRRRANENWLQLRQLERDPKGQLLLEDEEVQPGAVVAYRLKLQLPTLEVVTAEVSVTVPAAVPFALKGLNVRQGRLRLFGSVPSKGESRFELFDVQGRRLFRDIRQHEHAGEVTLEWPAPPGTRGSVYFARFSFGRETKTRRFVLGI